MESNRPDVQPAAARGPVFSTSAKRGALAACIVAILIAGVILVRHMSGYVTTDDAQVDTHLYSVSARVPGYVLAVNVSDNQYVERGALLVELDPTDYKLAVERARADLASSEATARSMSIAIPITAASTSSQVASAAADIESARAAVAAAEQQLAAAHAQLEEAQASDARVQDDLQRYRLLAEKEEISAQLYAQAAATARASSAAVAGAHANEAAARQAIRQAIERETQARAGHQSARANVGQVQSTRSRAAAAAADVTQKRAALDQALHNLQYTRIVAPISGQVKKNVVTGRNVQPGQELLTIVPLDDVWITANFKETQLRSVRRGQLADVEVDASGRTYRGRVDSIGAATGPVFSILPPENATGNYVKIVQRIPVKITLEQGENRDRQLRPGMNVVPTIYLR
jgi:membrane fusion protein (multidrug efflux system)